MKMISFLTSCICQATLFMTCCCYLSAADESKPLALDASLCTKQNLMTFFPEPVVKAVLQRYQVPQQDIDAIAKDLAQKDLDVAKAVELKAANMQPNPFKDPSQRDVAHKVFRETLFEVFASTMKAHGMQDEDQLQAILEEIRSTKSKLFVECILKESPPAKPAKPDRRLRG